MSGPQILIDVRVFVVCWLSYSSVLGDDETSAERFAIRQEAHTRSVFAIATSMFLIAKTNERVA